MSKSKWGQCVTSRNPDGNDATQPNENPAKKFETARHEKASGMEGGPIKSHPERQQPPSFARTIGSQQNNERAEDCSDEDRRKQSLGNAAGGWRPENLARPQRLAAHHHISAA